MSCAPRLGQRLSEFKAPSRRVNRVFIHCSATSRDSIDAKEVHNWHKNRGWSCIGYHFFIRSDGVIEYGRDLERTPAAQSRHNTGTIAICLNGLNPWDFTEAQFDALKKLCYEINSQIPEVTFHGHCEVSAKSCPVFDYKLVLGLENGRLAYKYMEEIEAEIIVSRETVVDWQRENNLYPDGVVGPKTWSKLIE